MGEERIGREGNALVENVTIQLDAQPYNAITFHKCILVLTGLAPVHLSDCDMIECQFVLQGPALNIVAFLASIAQSGARPLVLKMLGLAE